MRIRKVQVAGSESKTTRVGVGNSPNLWGQKTQSEQKKVLVNSDFQFDPYLIAAILKRNIESIKSSINVTASTGVRVTLSEDQHNIFKTIYKEIYTNPVKLAMKICDSETLETTQGNDPTRFDVLHCLAENWDALIKSAEQKGHPIPDLKEVLDYARDLSSHIPLHTFILGLSDEKKEEAAIILNAKVSKATPAP